MSSSFFRLGVLLCVLAPATAMAQVGTDVKGAAGGRSTADAQATNFAPAGAEVQVATPPQTGGDLHPAASFFAGGLAGFQGGPSLQAFVQVQDFAQGLPIKARFRVARTLVEPGSAPDARRIFINDATNGTPQKKGHTLDLGVDGLYPLGRRTYLFAGMRHTRFTANFNFVGGNEDFDVTSAQWGLGGGMEASFPMSPKMDLILSAGGEYFFPARLTGHDTSYAPDGDNVNPRKDYTYADAEAAVNQPTWRPAGVVGISYRLGR
jgi:hypothetical protein